MDYNYDYRIVEHFILCILLIYKFLCKYYLFYVLNNYINNAIYRTLLQFITAHYVSYILNEMYHDTL